MRFIRNQIVLVRNSKVAQELIDLYRTKNIPTATVEVEFGDICIEGSHSTLAHHTTKYAHFPAPCVRDEINPMKNGVILISHLDLDTLGGIQILEGNKIQHKSFWTSEFLIDTKGYRGHELIPIEDDILMKSYWGWDLLQEGDQKKINSFNEQFLDVTEIVEKRSNYINKLLTASLDSEIIQQGLKEFNKRFQLFMNDLVYQDQDLRVFITNEIQHYLSHQNGLQTVKTCITLNKKKGSIIISDITESLNCKDIMQSVFGALAGGQYRVAGTPRNELFTEKDIIKLCIYLNECNDFSVDIHKISNLVIK